MEEQTPLNDEVQDKRALARSAKAEARLAEEREQKQHKTADFFKLILAALLVVGSVGVNYMHLGLPEYAGVLLPVVGVVTALAIFLFWCYSGSRLRAYIRDSIKEVKKVVWPERQYTVRMTVFVIVFVAILALIMYVADAAISWLFFDVLLKRG